MGYEYCTKDHGLRTRSGKIRPTRKEYGICPHCQNAKTLDVIAEEARCEGGRWRGSMDYQQKLNEEVE